MATREGFRDIEHLLRTAGLFVAVVVLFLIVRSVLVPEGFGDYGHYRPGAIDDVRTREPVYAGREACEECHDDVADARLGGAHQRVGCEACHGPLGAHAEDPSEVVPERPAGRTLCLVCHRASGYRPDDFPQVDPEEHSMGEVCISCHDPHHPDMP